VSTPESSNPALRLTVLTVLVAMMLGALLSRLWFLQVLAGDRYAELAQSNEVRTVLTEAPRGRILDRDGRELVKNRVAHTISADRNRLLDAVGEPKDDQAAETLERLSDLLELPRDEIISRMTSVRYSPLRATPIAIDVAPEIVFAVSEHAELFPGVVAERLPVRTYPYGDLAAHVVGHVAEISQGELEDDFYKERAYQPGDVVGKAGIERGYEEYLQGTEGLRRLRVNATGTVLSVLGEREYEPGHDVVSTIDAELQGQVEHILEQGVLASRKEIHTSSGRSLKSTGASAVVLDPRNGEIVAMASYPTFDPREYVGGLSPEYARYLYPQEGDPDTHAPAINRAIASAQPPGSVWKIVSGLAALQAGQITPNSYIDCPGVFDQWEKYNWNRSNEGPMDLATALKRSCDTFFYTLSFNQWLTENRAEEAGEDPEEVYQRVARAFGFDEPLGIEIPGERGGTVPGRAWKKDYWERNKDVYCQNAEASPPGTYQRQLYSELCNEGYVWRGGDAVNMSIGQGDVQATPLQVATAYAAVANGGTVYRPHLADEIRSVDGETVTAVDPEVVNHIDAPEEHWAELRFGLEQVVMGERGTAVTPFDGFPLDRFPIAGKTGTAEAGSSQIPYSWFASYAPANDPQYVVVVLVEEGGGGSQTAAPIVRRIYDAIFELPVTRFEAGDASILD
jgi:penicillin-binding protein 2